MRYQIKDFLPLIIIASLICVFTFIRQFFYPAWNLMFAMQDFMAGFFIIFGFFKLLNLKAFVEAYKKYDLGAQHSTLYAYAYPCIEICLGLAYLFRFLPILTNLVTYTLMLFSAIGVALALASGQHLMCACLGTVFKLPMTYVTIFEDVLMAGMALGMLLSILF